MPSTDEAEHLSIGEVLSLLQSEFPDVTISKIRFLEGQGLIDPERTPSGYRMFYELDIQRLRWILRQQRDHFLPLKVIKAKLEQGGEIDFESNEAIQPTLWSEDAAAERSATPPADAFGGPVVNGANGSSPSGVPGVDGASGRRRRDAERDAAAWLAALQESPRPSTSSQRSSGAGGSDSDRVDARPMPAGPRIGRTELSEVTGVDDDAIELMITFGLLVPSMIGGEATFDSSSVAVVRAVATFLGRGIEPRHLRIFKNAADREAGFYEQMILPLLKQRNPKSRELATNTLANLMAAGDELNRTLIRQALRSHLSD